MSASRPSGRWSRRLGALVAATSLLLGLPSGPAGSVPARSPAAAPTFQTQCRPQQVPTAIYCNNYSQVTEVPDPNAGAIAVPSMPGDIVDVNVYLHGLDANADLGILRVYVTAPNGAEVDLIHSVCAWQQGVELRDVVDHEFVIDDNVSTGPLQLYAEPGPQDACWRGADVIQPSDRVHRAERLARLNGAQAAGQWRIHIEVTNPVYHASLLRGWGLGITTKEVAETPQLFHAIPVGPLSSTTVAVTGLSEPDSTVTLWDNPSCAGAGHQLGSGSAAELGSTQAGGGIKVVVPRDRATGIYAQASVAGKFDSECSGGLTYTNDSTAPDAPVLSSVSPGSPGTSLAPAVSGIADAGSVVRLYTTADCTGVSVASVVAGPSKSFTSSLDVAAGSTTTLHATAMDASENVSPCSTTSVTYTHVPGSDPSTVAPDTVLDQTPRARVRTAKRRTTVAFGFHATTAGATFQCSLDGAAFVPCASVRSVKVKRGRHTFAVRAVLGAAVDASPATYRFKVVRRRR